MESLSEYSRFMPIILLVGGLGLAWLALRVVFHLAKRVFMLGCLGIVILGVLIYMAGT
ncbi:MAG: hypothetical protein OEV06_07530 [Anaerolineae bacterium]|nr:hypothetical protein [Anaerolineae bacterium]